MTQQGDNDSPSGKQYVVHYRHEASPNSWQKGSIYNNEPQAVASLMMWRDQTSVLEAKLFIRDVTPWVEVTE